MKKVYVVWNPSDENAGDTLNTIWQNKSDAEERVEFCGNDYYYEEMPLLQDAHAYNLKQLQAEIKSAKEMAEQSKRDEEERNRYKAKRQKEAEEYLQAARDELIKRPWDE